MRRLEGYALWLGHVGDLLDVSMVMNSGIEAVIELADNEPLAVLPRSLIRLRFPLSDGGDNPPWLLRLAVESTATLAKTGVPTLVCCSGGMSRSVCVAAGAIAVLDDIFLPQALSIVAATGPADVSPSLFAQLVQAVDGSTQ